MIEVMARPTTIQRRRGLARPMGIVVSMQLVVVLLSMISISFTHSSLLIIFVIIANHNSSSSRYRRRSDGGGDGASFLGASGFRV